MFQSLSTCCATSSAGRCVSSSSFFRIDVSGRIIARIRFPGIGQQGCAGRIRLAAGLDEGQQTERAGDGGEQAGDSRLQQRLVVQRLERRVAQRAADAEVAGECAYRDIVRACIDFDVDGLCLEADAARGRDEAVLVLDDGGLQGRLAALEGDVGGKAARRDVFGTVLVLGRPEQEDLT